jgi:hypothetical protein
MRLRLLLPERARLHADAEPEALRRLLGRADAPARLEPGSRAQLQRHCRLLPKGWPMAALTRQLDCGDAEGSAWLRADPVHVRADINAVRMLGWGNLRLSAPEAQALLKPLKLLFGDAGFPISAPVPERWYLMMPREARLPAFVDPEDVLGDEIHDRLPQGDAGRRWRQLLTEAQILLHNHPVNARRQEQGVPAVNSLWFWGGGGLPDQVAMDAARVFTREVGLGALATRAGCAPDARPSQWQADLGDALVDLRDMRELDALVSDWIEPAVAAVRARQLAGVDLDFADGVCVELAPGQHWRFWRKPRSLFA